MSENLAAMKALSIDPATIFVGPDGHRYYPTPEHSLDNDSNYAESKFVSTVARLLRDGADDEKIREAFRKLDLNDVLHFSDRVVRHLERRAKQNGEWSLLEYARSTLPGQMPLERERIERALMKEKTTVPSPLISETSVEAPTLSSAADKQERYAAARKIWTDAQLLSPDAKTVHEAISTVVDDRLAVQPAIVREELKDHAATTLQQHELVAGVVSLTSEIRVAAGKPPEPEPFTPTRIHTLEEFTEMARQVHDLRPGVEERIRDQEISIPPVPPKQHVPESVDEPTITLTRRGDSNTPTPATPDVPSLLGYIMREKGEERLYYQSDDGQLAIRATEQRIDGVLRDARTISAMLDLAEARGWRDLQIKGDMEIARDTWIEATARGMKAEGYLPNRDDLHAMQQRRIERNEQSSPTEDMNYPPPPKMEMPSRRMRM